MKPVWHRGGRRNGGVFRHHVDTPGGVQFAGAQVNRAAGCAKNHLILVEHIRSGRARPAGLCEAFDNGDGGLVPQRLACSSAHAVNFSPSFSGRVSVLHFAHANTSNARPRSKSWVRVMHTRRSSIFQRVPSETVAVCSRCQSARQSRVKTATRLAWVASTVGALAAGR